MSVLRLTAACEMGDPAAEENLNKLRFHIRRTPVLPISAAFDVGVDKFKQTIRAVVEVATAE